MLQKTARLVKGAVGPAQCGRRRGGFGRGQEQENRGKRPGQEHQARNSKNGKSLANLILVQHAAAWRGGGSLRAFRRAMIDGKVAKGTTTTWKFQTFQFTCFRGATFPNRVTKTTKVVKIDVKNDLPP